MCGFSPSDSVVATEVKADELQEKLQAEFKDRFTLIAPVGFTRGSFLYLARDPGRVTPVAVKIIPFEKPLGEDELARFDADATQMKSLNGPLLLQLLDFGVTDRFLWYSREHAQGDSLDEVIRKRAPMSVEESVAVVCQIISALGYLHSQDFCHGNVIPSNIFIDKSIARLSDAGIAHSLTNLTLSNRFASQRGAVDYLAPEFSDSHEVSPGADQYAMAIVLYQCLTGKHPFVGDSPEEVRRLHQASAPPSLENVRPDVPKYVSQAVARAMDKTPKARFADILQFGVALEAVKEPVRLPSNRPGAETRPSQVIYVEQEEIEGEAKKSRLKAVLFAVILILALAIPSVVYWRAQNAAEVADAEPRWHSSSLTTGVLAVPEPADESGTTIDSLQAARIDGPSVPDNTVNAPPPTPVAQPVVTRPRPRRTPVDRTPGQVSINSRPWGLVYLDGQLLGNSPRVNISVTPGEHRIRVTRVGFTTFEQTFTVAPGEDVRLTGIVLEESPQ